MKINKYKKLKNGKYLILFENNKELELYEELILKYNLLLTKELKEDKEIEILKENKKYKIYYEALEYLKKRNRSKKEINAYLINKKYETELINIVIEKLEIQGYINDLNFSKSFLNNKLLTTNNGPLKIKNDLRIKGISDNIIDLVLEDYSIDIEKEKIEKRVNKSIKSNKNKSNSFIKKKIITELSLEGFNKFLICDIVDSIEMVDDTPIAKKEYEKLYKKLSKKYNGNELEFKIKQKLYQKGFNYIDD